MIKIARIKMKCIDPGQRRRTNFHEGGAGLRSVRLALEDAAVRGLVARCLFTQNYTRHWIGPERGTALQVHVIGQIIDPFEIVERAVFRHVDGLGYRIVDEWLQCCLHVEMGADREVSGRDEAVRGRCQSSARAPQLKRIVGKQDSFGVPSSASTLRI